MRSPQPSLALLATFSENSLEGFELARLDEIAQLRREVQEIHEEWIEAEVAARLARLLLEGGRAHHAAEAESLALPDRHAGPNNLPAPPPVLRGLHAKTNSAVLLGGMGRKQQAAHALRTAQPTADLALESVMASVRAPNQAAASAQIPADFSRPANPASPAISRQAETSRGNPARNHQRPVLASAKIRSTPPLRSGASLQLPLFAETQPNPDHPETSPVQPRAQHPTILCLIRRPRVPGHPSFSLCDFPAAS